MTCSIIAMSLKGRSETVLLEIIYVELRIRTRYYLSVFLLLLKIWKVF